jgi:hypothetical protein
MRATVTSEEDNLENRDEFERQDSAKILAKL